ncbi:succinate dehydrogenase assembly factor 2, mitochondrial [Drosophila sulfurigaster albostrigata]|uniref:succinate dehydrogenase assembly factor 2, mitochondrial n=1 Tax=Drosophila sulfurigaster albostrigata TaxID=89887 RepID=UPI002D21CDE6|nr:succinate dehydrogenase assembly factor 2, mitochondrial [Drosophila sulfurigaster albostrigata]
MLRQLLSSTATRRVLLPRATATRFVSSNQNGLDKTEFTTPPEVIDYEDPSHLPLPQYPARPDEPLQARKQRLLYQSRKRGMLENDLLLSTFVAKYLKDFNAEQTALYDDLINGVSNDWDIFYWATETKPTPPEYDTEIMKLLKEHVKNAERVQRIRQPDL